MTTLFVMIQSGRYKDAERKFGKDAIGYELEDMLAHDRADTALEIANALGYKNYAERAQRIIACSGSYKKK